MSLILIGTNYKYCDLSRREKLFFSKNDGFFFLNRLIESDYAKAAVILSTCSRIEIYALVDNSLKLKDFFISLFGQDNLNSHIYVKEGNQVITHLFNVAAGLDSPILGESQILHQVKEAYLRAKTIEVTNSILNKIFERALFVGKLVRSHTSIARRDPSIASEAVEKAWQTYKNFDKKNIFIAGAGLIAQNLVKICFNYGANCIIIANRTLERAQALAKTAGGKAIQFKEFYQMLDEVDILFSATSSPHLILKKEVFTANRRRGQPILIFDLAIPRDIDSDIGNFKGVTLFNVDAFNTQEINSEVFLAQSIVEEKAQSFINKEEYLWNLRLEYAQAI